METISVNQGARCNQSHLRMNVIVMRTTVAAHSSLLSVMPSASGSHDAGLVLCVRVGLHLTLALPVSHAILKSHHELLFSSNISSFVADAYAIKKSPVCRVDYAYILVLWATFTVRWAQSREWTRPNSAWKDTPNLTSRPHGAWTVRGGVLACRGRVWHALYSCDCTLQMYSYLGFAGSYIHLHHPCGGCRERVSCKQLAGKIAFSIADAEHKSIKFLRSVRGAAC